MEFFLFLLYNQESSREKYFPAKRGEINMKGTSCEFCANYTYDDECDEYYCDINLDEDEYYRFVSSDYKECPYYRSGDEYKVVRHQMCQRQVFGGIFLQCASVQSTCLC